MTEDFLHCPKVGSAVQQMGGGGVPESVGSGGSGVSQCVQYVFNHRANLPLVHPPAPCAEEERRTAPVHSQQRASAAQPVIHGDRRRQPVRNCPLFVALADHPERPPVGIKIVHVHPCQFSDTDAGGVEQLHHCTVPEGERSAVFSCRLQMVDDAQYLLLVQDTRQGPFPFRRLKSQRRVGPQELFPHRPGGEGPGRSSTPGQCGPGHARLALRAEPASQRGQFDPVEVSGAVCCRHR
ncbi:hypothetical protein D9M72_510060 [compost metagenome]